MLSQFEMISQKHFTIIQIISLMKHEAISIRTKLTIINTMNQKIYFLKVSYFFVAVHMYMCMYVYVIFI